MTETTHAKIPSHLMKYVVQQNYARYTPEDQAVWRYIMRQLKDYLSTHAHEAYLSGLEKTGITLDRIPEIENIDRKLNQFGWGAVPVSGFIPPAAFMEFQAIGVLPIASDMRTLAHLRYTPAPDIVHEAAGHAPIIADPEYAAYLRQYGEVARHSIISKQDLDQYEAVRVLSDIKEDPRSTREEIERAEQRLHEINEKPTMVSEATLLSRMNWWTAEYGLIGDLAQPRIFGAGLLSSVGESRDCLDEGVKKIPLSVECVNYTYDITEQQPQLFVTKDFAQLGSVLNDLAGQLSYRRGGRFGLDRAIEAQTVNSVELNSGLQISGLMTDYIVRQNQPAYVRFRGPCQLSLDDQQIPNQGTAQHPDGFSSPLGLLTGQKKCLSQFSDEELKNIAITKGQPARLNYASGVVIEGRVTSWLRHENKIALISWEDCRATLDGDTLFDPSWGSYDMAVGCEVTAVFGGPADRGQFGETEDFARKTVPSRTPTSIERERYAFFQNVRELRDKGVSLKEWQKLRDKFDTHLPWLIGVELLEMAYSARFSSDEIQPLLNTLNQISAQSSVDERQSIADGLRLAKQGL